MGHWVFTSEGVLNLLKIFNFFCVLYIIYKFASLFLPLAQSAMHFAHRTDHKLKSSANGFASLFLPLAQSAMHGNTETLINLKIILNTNIKKR